MRYTQSQKSFRGGELGNALSGKNHHKVFYTGLRVAENCDIDLVGNIQNRIGFSYITKAPVTDALKHYKHCKFAFKDTFGAIHYRLVLFTEYLMTVYSVDENYQNLIELCEKVTDKSAVLMNLTNDTSIKTKKGERGIIFCNKAVKPFILKWSNNASQASDFSITDVVIKHLPNEQFSNANKTGTELDSGPINIEITNALIRVIATNNCFTSSVTSDYEGKTISIVPQGGLRIKRKVDNKTLECAITRNLGQIESINPADFILYTGEEPIASNTRGWFSCCAVHEGRLYFANTRDIPNALICSTTDYQLNFDLGQQNDYDGCFTLIDTSSTDEIVSLKSGSTLHIYTRNELFVLSSGSNKVVPSNFDTTKVSSGGGSDSYTDSPQTQEGGLIYIDSKHEQLFYVAYDSNAESYSPKALSVALPEGMITQSDDTFSLVLINYGSNKGQCVYFINNNLDIVKCLLMLDEDVSPIFTHYRFASNLIPLKLFAMGTQLYAIFNEVNSNTNFIASLNSDCYLDAAYNVNLDATGKATLPADYPALTNARYFDFTSGSYGNVSIPSSRQITIEDSANHRVQIGEQYTFNMVTFERNGNIEEVPYSTGKKKNITELRVGVSEAVKLEVAVADNNPLSIVNWVTLCDEKVTNPATNILKTRHLLGWYDKPILLFKQEAPGPIFISDYEVDVLM